MARMKLIPVLFVEQPANTNTAHEYNEMFKAKLSVRATDQWKDPIRRQRILDGQRRAREERQEKQNGEA